MKMVLTTVYTMYMYINIVYFIVFVIFGYFLQKLGMFVLGMVKFKNAGQHGTL